MTHVNYIGKEKGKGRNEIETGNEKTKGRSTEDEHRQDVNGRQIETGGSQSDQPNS